MNGFYEGGVKIIKITPTIASFDTYEGSVKVLKLSKGSRWTAYGDCGMDLVERRWLGRRGRQMCDKYQKCPKYSELSIL